MQWKKFKQMQSQVIKQNKLSNDRDDILCWLFLSINTKTTVDCCYSKERRKKLTQTHYIVLPVTCNIMKTCEVNIWSVFHVTMHLNANIALEDYFHTIRKTFSPLQIRRNENHLIGGIKQYQIETFFKSIYSFLLFKKK